MFTLKEIQESVTRVSPYITRTPLVKSHILSDRLQANIYLKMELLQVTGSFKPRGAFNQMLLLSERAKNAGVVAVSGGNFAQAVAYAGSRLGVDTIICMPEYTPENYIIATRSYGARVEFAKDFQSTIAKSKEFVQQGYTLLHAWDNTHQMCGNGTLGLEILKDLPEITDIFISIGGGGLIAGIIVAIKSLNPAVRIWGVETAGSETMGAALEAGKVVQITPKSLAKTLGAHYIAQEALNLAQQHLEELVIVTDEEAVADQIYMLEKAKVLTELAASCTLSAANRLKGRFGKDQHVVLLLCGGNETLKNMNSYRELLAH